MQFLRLHDGLSIFLTSSQFVHVFLGVIEDLLGLQAFHKAKTVNMQAHLVCRLSWFTWNWLEVSSTILLNASCNGFCSFSMASVILTNLCEQCQQKHLCDTSMLRAGRFAQLRLVHLERKSLCSSEQSDDLLFPCLYHSGGIVCHHPLHLACSNR